jgi:hypothetical protein
MNNGIRITIDRRDGNRWYWKLNAYGDEYYDGAASFWQAAGCESGCSTSEAKRAENVPQ